MGMGETAQSASNVAPLGLLFLAVMVIMIWRARREHALFPLLITTCYMPLGQEFVVAGLNLQFIRILILAGWLRVVARGEFRDFRLTPLDKLFLWWSAVTVVLGTLAEPGMSRFINRSGLAFNALGSYFLVRCWVRDFDDVLRGVRFLSLMIVPLALSMIVEKFTARNIFSVFGGVPELTQLRDGTLRCQGAFRHPILAGTYGATLFPVFVGLYFTVPREKRRALLGAGSAAIVTLSAGSSGALLAFLAGCGGLMLWRMRHNMRLIRWSVVAMIGLLALVMKAPVWYAIGRLSEVVGGTGWYRSHIIDQAIRHFDEWWLVGSTYTAHWAPGGEVVAADPNNMDIINHYVAEGLGGGIVKLALFVTMIVLCFRIVGRWVRELDDTVLRPAAFLVWSLGACLFAHCVSFFSVSYFDQIVIMYYWLLAVIASLGLVLESRRWALAAQDSAAFPTDPNLQGAEPASGLAEPATLGGGN